MKYYVYYVAMLLFSSTWCADNDPLLRASNDFLAASPLEPLFDSALESTSLASETDQHQMSCAAALLEHARQIDAPAPGHDHGDLDPMPRRTTPSPLERLTFYHYHAPRPVTRQFINNLQLEAATQQPTTQIATLQLADGQTIMFPVASMAENIAYLSTLITNSQLNHRPDILEAFIRFNNSSNAKPLISTGEIICLCVIPGCPFKTSNLLLLLHHEIIDHLCHHS